MSEEEELEAIDISQIGGLTTGPKRPLSPIVPTGRLDLIQTIANAVSTAPAVNRLARFNLGPTPHPSAAAILPKQPPATSQPKVIQSLAASQPRTVRPSRPAPVPVPTRRQIVIKVQPKVEPDVETGLIPLAEVNDAIITPDLILTTVLSLPEVTTTRVGRAVRERAVRSRVDVAALGEEARQRGALYNPIEPEVLAASVRPAQGYNATELKEFAAERGLPYSGTKGQLIERLKLFEGLE
jgi:hypothetical protein